MILLLWLFLFIFAGKPRLKKRGRKGGLTMRSSRSHSVHIRAEIRMSGRGECTVRDALGIQPEPVLLRVVLTCGQRAGDDLALVAVTPALHVLVRVVGARGLRPLQVCVVEDLLGVRGGEARHDYVAVAVGVVFVFIFGCHD